MEQASKEKLNHKLITIEGTDGSGKGTQTTELFRWLKSEGHEVIIIRFPNYDSTSAGPVKMYLSGELGSDANCLDAYQASALYAVDRLCTMRQILSKLTQDTIIIFDRYVQSNMMHQAGKIKNRGELDKFLDWLWDLEFTVLGLPVPDRVLFLDLPPEISYKIATSRVQLKIGEEFDNDIHESDESHFFDTYNAAKYVSEKYSWDVLQCMNEDGTRRTVEEIRDDIRATVSKLISSTKDTSPDALPKESTLQENKVLTKTKTTKNKISK